MSERPGTRTALLRILLLLALGAVVVAFFAFDLQHLLTLEGLRASQQKVSALLAESWWQVVAVYFLLYVVVAAVSLPGAVPMTLAGGALFGLAWGTVIVSFASTLGATLALLGARFLLREPVQRRFGERLRAIDAGFAREGALYLFTLRLVPVFPFFAVNLLMGLTPIRVRTFWWVSQLGMIPGTLVFVNAGTQLATIDSLRGIASPALLGSFALLGIFPLLAKRIVEAVRRRNVYARWEKPARFDRNLVVIGAGSAGLVSAYIAAAVKAKVTLVERHAMGGDCLNTGCVPSKALLHAARLAHAVRDARRFGIEAGEPAIDFRAVMAHVRAAIRTIEPHDSVERYTKLGVDVRTAHARLVDPWTVELTQADGARERLTTRAVVIATGAEPFVPPLPGIEQSGCLTSETLWDALADLAQPPARFVVLGGGPIGCELAQAFARLGSKVTVVQRQPRLLVREDSDVSAALAGVFAREGIELLTGHQAVRCEQHAGLRTLIVEHEGRERALEYDALLCAVGRVARLTGHGLEELGIETGRTVVVDEYLATLYPNIYAAGDVAGPFQFTHTGSHQAWYAAVNALFGGVWRFRADYRVIPWVTFTDPEIARVGLSEDEAREKRIPFEVTRYALEDQDRAICEGAAEGFVKLLTPPGKDRILGAVIVGAQAGELLAEIVLAMRHGIGLNKLLGTIHSYPTLGEANKAVAGAWKRNNAPQNLLAWVERFHAWRRGA